MNRVSLLCLVVAVVAASASACVGTPEPRVESGEEESLSGTLHLLNWQGYGSDEPWAHEMFKEKHGVEVVHDYYNSNEELLTKLRTNPGTYDAVLIGNTWGATAIDEALLAPIDVDALQHYGDLSDQLVDLPEMRDDRTVYGVPWSWGATGIAYNEELIDEEIDSIQVFWDPQYAGRIAWQDYYIDNVMFAAIALRQDPNDPAQLEAVREKLIDLMPQVRTLWASEAEFNQLFSAEEILLGTYWSGSSARANKMGLPLRFVVPKEGAIGWVDSWAIPNDAPHPEAALRWIDFMISPEFYLEFDARVGAPVPSNERTVERLPDDSLNKSYLSRPEIRERLTFYAPLSEETKQTWLELWQEVKATQ